MSETKKRPKRIRRLRWKSLKRDKQWDVEILDKVCKEYNIDKTTFKINYSLYNYYVTKNMNTIAILHGTMYRTYNAFFIPGILRVRFQHSILERDFLINTVLNSFPQYRMATYPSRRNFLRDVTQRINKITLKSKKLTKAVQAAHKRRNT